MKTRTLDDSVTYCDQTFTYELPSEWFSHNGDESHAPDINIKCISKNSLSDVNFDLNNIHASIKIL